LERRLKKRGCHAQELEIASQKEWSNLPEEVYNKLIENMPKRIEACISNNG